MAGDSLPTGWRLTKLGDLGEVNRGRSRHRPRYAEHLYGGPYPFIQTGDIKNSGGRLTTYQQTYSEAGLAQSRMWPKGTRCITIAANIAETAILGFPACFPDSVVGFVADESKCDLHFIEHTFRHLKHLLQHEASGSVQDNINLATLERLWFPLPPLPEQSAIAHILGSLDDKIELNRRMNETLEAMARALFRSWFVDFDPVRAKAEGRDPGLPKPIADLFPDSFEDSELGEIPKGWAVKQIGDFIERLPVGQKYEQKTVNQIGKVPVLDQGKSGVIGYHDDAPGVVASIDAPVVVFANHTCYMRLIHFSFSAIQNVLPFIGKGVDTVWAFYATYGKQSFNEYKGHWPDLVIHKIAVPDQKLTTEFSRLVQPLLKQTWMKESETRTLSTLRDTLLPKLISGELRMKDAERFTGRTT